MSEAKEDHPATLDYVPLRPVQPMLPKFGAIALIAAILAPIMDLLLKSPGVPRLRDRGRIGVSLALALISLAFAIVTMINKGRDRPLAFWAISILALTALAIAIQEM